MSIAQTTLPSQATFTASRFYLPELDLVRLFAFFLVFLSHVVPGEPEFYARAHIPESAAAVIVSVAAGGAFGVDLFFALSSFLITTLLIRERRASGRIDIVSFYLRRILRIWPLYFVFLLIVAPLVHPFIAADVLPGRDAVAFLLLLGNWAFVLWGYAHSFLVPLWSVSVEEQFYLGWPLLLRRFPTHLRGALLGLWLLCAATRLLLVLRGAVHPQIWCNTLAHLDPIIGGGLLALIANERTINLPNGLRLVLLCSGVGVFALAARFGDFVGARALITYPAVALAACVLIAASLHPKVELRRYTVLKPLLHLGKISYGLYVFHLMFITLLGVGAAHTLGRRAGLICAAFLCTVLAALASYKFLERPFLALKARFTHIASRPL